MLPGTYTISVCVGVTPCAAQIVDTGSEITVATCDDLGTINGTVLNGTVALHVDVQATSATAQGILQNDAQLCIASRIAQASNVSLGTIINMRQQHMGWGKIAHQENVPASVIGGGNQCDATELNNIRAANGQETDQGTVTGTATGMVTGTVRGKERPNRSFGPLSRRRRPSAGGVVTSGGQLRPALRRHAPSGDVSA